MTVGLLFSQNEEQSVFFKGSMTRNNLETNGLCLSLQERETLIGSKDLSEKGAIFFNSIHSSFSFFFSVIGIPSGKDCNATSLDACRQEETRK